MVLVSFHALASSWVYTDLEFRALGVTLITLLLLDVVSKVSGSDFGEIRHSIKTLP